MTWKEENNTLTKTFELDSFSEIIKRLQSLSKICDEAEHHPDLEVYGYKNIRFKLTTHDAKKVTDKDYALAEEIDQLFA